MDMSLVASMPTDRAVSLEREMLPGLLDGRARGVVFDAPFVDIGVPESYAALAADPGAVLPTGAAPPS
jgi:NDP-sugar pyrophosphorylase family protein